MKLTLYKKMRSKSRLHRNSWKPFRLDFHPEWYHLPNFIAFADYLLGAGEYRVMVSVRKRRKAVWKTIARFRCEGERRFVVHEEEWGTLMAD